MLEPWHIEEIIPGVTREWSVDHRLVIFRLTDYKRPSIDSWASAIEETIVAEERPRLLVYHFAGIPVSLSVYYLQQRLRLLDLYADEQLRKLGMPSLHTYIAAVPPRQFAPVAKFIVSRHEAVRRGFGLTVEVFSTLEDALAWLLSCED